MSLSLNKTSRFFFYIFIFLLPFFCITNLSIPFEASKIVILLTFLGFTSILGIIGTIKEGKIEVGNKTIPLFTLLFFLFAGLSTLLFSLSKTSSFLGGLRDSGTSHSLITFLLYACMFFLPLLVINKKEHIRKLGLAFAFSILTLNTMFLIETLLGVEIRILLTSLNTFAILNVLGLIALFFLFKEEKNPTIKGVLGLSFFVFGAGLVLVNLSMSWFILGIASFLLFWASLLNGKHNFVFLLITLVSVVFFVLDPSLSFEKKTHIQSLGYSESIEIAKKPSFLGSGLGTFDKTFLKVNPTKLQTTYSESFSSILTLLNDLGIIGLLLFLAIFILASIKGFKRFLERKQNPYERMAFISFFTLFILTFFYNFGVILYSFLFLFLALFLILSSKPILILFKDLKADQIFFKVAGLSLFAILIIVFTYSAFLNLFAEKNYEEAIKIQLEDKDKAIEYLEKSNSFITKDKTQIELSRLYLLKASDLNTESKLLETKEENREVKQEECEVYLDLAEKTALLATKTEPYNHLTWINLGEVLNSKRKLKNEELEESVIQPYLKGIILAPFLIEHYNTLSSIYGEVGDLERQLEIEEKIRIIEVQK